MMKRPIYAKSTSGCIIVNYNSGRVIAKLRFDLELAAASGRRRAGEPMAIGFRGRIRIRFRTARRTITVPAATVMTSARRAGIILHSTTEFHLIQVRWVAFHRMNAGFMTWSEIYGSGVGTGLTAIGIVSRVRRKRTRAAPMLATPV
jgi:hypothetical protein